MASFKTGPHPSQTLKGFGQTTEDEGKRGKKRGEEGKGETRRDQGRERAKPPKTPKVWGLGFRV